MIKCENSPQSRSGGCGARNSCCARLQDAVADAVVVVVAGVGDGDPEQLGPLRQLLLPTLRPVKVTTKFRGSFPLKLGR